MTAPVYDSPLALAVALYNRPDHLPKRTCLGCGGCCYELAGGRRVSTDCTPRGAEVYRIDGRYERTGLVRLKPEYFATSVRNLRAAEEVSESPTLFGEVVGMR